MARGSIKVSVRAIRSAKWRSLLTILGVVIGVASVLTIISLGEGAKRHLASQLSGNGKELITIRPGRLVHRDANGQIQSVNVLSSFGFGSLFESDLAIIKGLPDIADSAAFAYVTGTAKTDDREFANGPVVATTDNAATILNQNVEYGNFFTASDESKQVAVIGKRVAEQLFGENIPIGRRFMIRGQTFIVQGVFEEFATSPFNLNPDYNYAIFIPYQTGKRLTGGQTALYQIIAKPSPAVSTDPVGSINAALSAAHGDQIDFTVLTAAENLSLASGVLNIMLVSVTERTTEVGIRKAVGATNRQIMHQFMIEAIILSLLGGMFGVLLALLINYLMRVLTDLTPVTTPLMMVMGIGISLTIGVIFGVMPALRAAHKDPIDALRHE